MEPEPSRVEQPEDIRSRSLHDALASIGWSHQPSKRVNARDVFDAEGNFVGNFTYDECWEHLELEGRLDHIQSNTPREMGTINPGEQMDMFADYNPAEYMQGQPQKAQDRDMEH